MPVYKPTDEELDGYGDGSAPVNPPETPAAETENESVDEENAGAAEILISKDKLPSGTKEGDTYTFKVSKDFGDEVSLEYVKEEEAPSTADTMNAETGSEISALDTKE